MEFPRSGGPAHLTGVTLLMEMAVALRQQKSLALILARGFASNLSIPISLHDPTGRVVFYNESAEAMFGVKFAETGELSAAEWTAHVSPEEADGTPIPLEEPRWVLRSRGRRLTERCTSRVRRTFVTRPR